MWSHKRFTAVIAIVIALTAMTATLAFAQGQGADLTGGTHTCLRIDPSREGSGAVSPVATGAFTLSSGIRFWTGLTIYRTFAPSLIAPSRATFTPSSLVRRRTGR
jgi:hypothetical protein